MMENVKSISEAKMKHSSQHGNAIGQKLDQKFKKFDSKII